jgi:RNA polymerase sigma-70 factor (ECF subfamily)
MMVLGQVIGTVSIDVPERVGAPTSTTATVEDFGRVYDTHIDYVWTILRRLGVPTATLEDAVQEVFIVVHRRLPEFVATGSIKSWIFGIALRVARDQRRRVRRKGGLEPLGDDVVDATPGPMESASRAEAVRVLDGLLDELDDEKRVVFVLAEIEQLTVPRIAEILGENANTIYSRVRAARAAFDAAVVRYRRRTG